MPTKFPFLDLAAANREIAVELEGAFRRVLGSGTYILGAELEAFEAEYAAYCQARHCVGVGNGLDALRLSLLALGVSPGDEVIVPAHTFIATWLAVSQCGAVPVPVEPADDSFNINAGSIEAAITPRTRAIVVVHLYGQPADLDPILDLANRRRLIVVEDAAQAHGARYKGKRIGAHSHAVAWSFYPGKNLGALGDGGAVTTDDHEVAERLRTLRNYGSKLKYHNETKGFNTRLDPLQAALLRIKLRRLDAGNDRRREGAMRYLSALSDHHNLVLPSTPAWSEPVWHLFVVRASERDVVRKQLADRGIETLIHYPVPPHLQLAYRDRGLVRGSLPLAERLANEVMSFPLFPEMTATHFDAVVSSLS